MAKPRPLILFTDQIHALMTADVKKKSFANASRVLITTLSGSCAFAKGHRDHSETRAPGCWLLQYFHSVMSSGNLTYR